MIIKGVGVLIPPCPHTAQGKSGRDTAGVEAGKKFPAFFVGEKLYLTS